MLSEEEWLERFFKEVLTPRQREVLELAILEGLPHKAIAERLGIGRRTVSNHITAIYDRLCGCGRRGLLLAGVRAWRRGELNLFGDKKR